MLSQSKHAIAAALSLSFTIAPAMASADDQAAFVESVRAAAERFQDINVALAEGYVPDPSGRCVTAASEGLPAELGGMGIHYMRPDLLGITAVKPRVDGTGTNFDFLNPSILLYEPQADGSFKLVGVENLVFEKAWKSAKGGERPSVVGRMWERMADDPATPRDEAHGFEAHFDQHVWFVGAEEHRLSPFNPAVTCAHHTKAR